MNADQAYSSDPEICSGATVFTGTRVPVQSLFDHLEAGESIDDFLEGFQTVRREQMIAVLEERNAGIGSTKVEAPADSSFKSNSCRGLPRRSNITR